MKTQSGSHLKKILTIIALSATFSSVVAWEDASAKATGAPVFSASDMETHFFSKRSDMVRLNLFYNLPFNARGYSFMDFKGDSGYYGKNQINIPLPVSFLQKIGLDLKAETKHGLYVSKFFQMYYNTVGFGLEKGTMLPHYGFLSVKVLPLVLGKDWYKDDEIIVGYFFTMPVYSNSLIDVNIGSYYDLNLMSKDYTTNKVKMDPKTDFGETHLSMYFKTKYGKFLVGGGITHDYSGKLEPNNYAVLKIGYHAVK